MLWRSGPRDKSKPSASELSEDRNFPRPIRKANTCLSAIRAHLGNLTRYAHPFRAAFGTLSRFARLWLGSLQPRSAPELLKDYPEVSREITESGHGLMLSFLKVAHQPESQQVTDEVSRLVSVIRGQMSRFEIQVLLGLRHLPHLRNAYLKPAIQHGLLEMTIPDKPQSRIQKYKLTPAGKTLAVAITSKK